MELNKINIFEYLNLEDTSEYDFLLDFVKPENKLCGNIFQVNKMTFNEFKTILSIFNAKNLQDITELFIHLYRISGNINQSAEQEFLNEDIFQFFRAKKFVKNMIDRNLELEVKMLYSEPDTRMIEIGGMQLLKGFDTILTKINLAEQFSTTPETIGGWKYTSVRDILAANNALNTVKKLYNGTN
tara:strand:- start:1401 stop:1955 length:555 start_codon:yes stop_codon:yes gene_type:complete